MGKFLPAIALVILVAFMLTFVMLNNDCNVHSFETKFSLVKILELSVKVDKEKTTTVNNYDGSSNP